MFDKTIVSCISLLTASLGFTQPITKEMTSNSVALMAGLFCAQNEPAKVLIISILEDKNRATSPQDGVFKLAGKITHRSLCMENVQVMGSFGIMMIFGEVCAGKAQDFERFLRSQIQGLRGTQQDDQVLALKDSADLSLAYKVGKSSYSFSLGRWQHQADFITIKKSETVRSFNCVQSSGSHN